MKVKNKIHCNKIHSNSGFTLTELLVVIAILVILVGVGSVAFAKQLDKANSAATTTKLDTYAKAVQQSFITHPEAMRFITSKPANYAELLVSYINEELESSMVFEVLPGCGDANGGIATSTAARDGWKNPYGLYIYSADHTTTYNDSSGVPFTDSDTCIYIVIVSSGKNGTGGPLGSDGSNYDSKTRKIVSATDMVNNSDGIDDIGVIIRILNGSISSANFGNERNTLGRLDQISWIYGVPDTAGGICYDAATKTVKTPTMGGSIDQFYDANAIENAISTATLPVAIGTW